MIKNMDFLIEYVLTWYTLTLVHMEDEKLINDINNLHNYIIQEFYVKQYPDKKIIYDEVGAINGADNPHMSEFMDQHKDKPFRNNASIKIFIMEHKNIFNPQMKKIKADFDELFVEMKIMDSSRKGHKDMSNIMLNMYNNSLKNKENVELTIIDELGK